MTSTFIYNGVSKKLNATKVIDQILSKLFNLEISSISLLSEDGKFYEPVDGTFSGLENGREYQVNGNPVTATSVSIAPSVIESSVANKPRFTSTEMKNIENVVLLQTNDMNKRLDGVAQAPLAVAMIQALATLAACTSDISLIHETTKNRIKLLKTPGSLKASLFQVAHESTQAFLTADSGMSKIKMNLATVPDIITVLLDAASDPTDPRNCKILEVNQKAIDRIANLCVEESKKVSENVQGVMNLTDELLEVAIATRGVKENEGKGLEDLYRQYQERKRHLEEEEKLKYAEIEKQQKETEKALNVYREKAETMGRMKDMFSACVLEMTSSAVQIDGVQQLTSEDQSKFNHTLEEENSLLMFLEHYCAQEFPSHQEIIERSADEKKCFAEIVNFTPVTVEGKHILAVATEYMNLLDKASDPDVYNQLKAKFRALEIAAENACKIRDNKIKSRAEKLKAAIGMMEQMNNTVLQAQANYKTQQDREDKQMDDAAQFRREISDVIAKLNNNSRATLSLGDIIKYLGQGLIILGNLKHAWVIQTQFFKSISNTVSFPMTETLNLFVEAQKNLVETSSSKQLKKSLISTSMKACVICFQIQLCADIYQEISQKYVIPNVKSVTRNLQLTKEEAQLKLTTINQSFEKLENEVYKLIQDKKTAMSFSLIEKFTECIGQLAITEE